MRSLQAPLSRLTGAMNRLVRTLHDPELPTIGSPARSGKRSIARASVIARYAGADRSSEVSTTVVDPDSGPTSRTEVLECGLTPEGYVRTVLEQHDGRLKQRRFMDDYDWSSATVSRLLSDLEDQGAIERYRLGREKVVCLPEAAPGGS